MKMLNGFAQGCILFIFSFPSNWNLVQLLRELLQQGPDEDFEGQHWQGSQPAADWSRRGHRKFSLKNKGMLSNALRSMRRLWPSLLRSSDLSPTRYDEKVFVKVKVMELKSKSHNFVLISRTNSGWSSLRTKVSKIQEWPLSPDNEEVAGARPSHGAAGEQTDGEQMITLNIKTGSLELYRTERLDFIEHLSIFNILTILIILTTLAILTMMNILIILVILTTLTISTNLTSWPS